MSQMTIVYQEDEIAVGVWAMEIVVFVISVAIIVINQELSIHLRTARTVRLAFQELLQDQRKVMNVESNGKGT